MVCVRPKLDAIFLFSPHWSVWGRDGTYSQIVTNREEKPLTISTIQRWGSLRCIGEVVIVTKLITCVP